MVENNSPKGEKQNSFRKGNEIKFPHYFSFLVFLPLIHPPHFIFTFPFLSTFSFKKRNKDELMYSCIFHLKMSFMENLLSIEFSV